MRASLKVSLVVPVFNEQEAIQAFYDEVKACNELSVYTIEIIFINDGSKDNTQLACSNIALVDPLVKIINFSRNFGKESALFAGLQYASGDVVIPIDVDLQDPIHVIPLMIEKWLNGAKVVLAKRVDRSSDTVFKRTTAQLFYQLHNKISVLKIEENVGDFRLMDKKVVQEIIKLPETNLFMKGLLSWVGFETQIIEYTRVERKAGTTKFNSWKLWNLALEGITSFSSLPLRLWTYIGAIISLGAFVYAIYMIFDKIIFGNNVPGYPSLLVSILFLGGVQLIGIGILGEYIGRIYTEVKNRPKFIISSLINIK